MPSYQGQTIKVKLCRQCATQRTDVGDFRVDTDQSEVLVNGMRVGYVCDPPEAPLNFIKRLPEGLKELIRAEVGRIKGAAVERVSEPPEIPDDFDDEADTVLSE